MSSITAQWRSIPVFYPYIDKKNKFRIEKLNIQKIIQMKEYIIKELSK